MISYIFKSKIKNILVVIFSAILVCINLNALQLEIMFFYWESMVIRLIALIPYLLIFIYMVTLKKEYKIKPFIFPMAFAFLALSTLFSLKHIFNPYIYVFANRLAIGLISLILYVVELLGYVFCFVGALCNFKRINFLRVGTILCTLSIFLLFLFDYSLSFLSTNTFFQTVNNLAETPRTIILLLFHISIFTLTLTKKSDYIDLAPFIEKRKLKKELKKAQKFAKENPEAFIPPVVPDGHWRCMGCGEFLPDNETECNCGYKKQ